MARQTSWSWQKRVERERRRLERDPRLAVCWLCGESIDMSLPYLHRNGFTLDHVVPVAKGGHDHGEALPAHRSCNSARGNAHAGTNDNVFGLDV